MARTKRLNPSGAKVVLVISRLYLRVTPVLGCLVSKSVAILKPLPQQALVKAELVQAGSATKLDMADVELELELTVDGGTEELEDLVVVPELTEDEVEEAFVEVEEAFVEVLLVFDVDVDVLLVEVEVLLVDVLVLEVVLWRTTKSPSRS
jgi:hypothetical protein